MSVIFSGCAFCRLTSFVMDDAGSLRSAVRIVVQGNRNSSGSEIVVRITKIYYPHSRPRPDKWATSGDDGGASRRGEWSERLSRLWICIPTVTCHASRIMHPVPISHAPHVHSTLDRRDERVKQVRMVVMWRMDLHVSLTNSTLSPLRDYFDRPQFFNYLRSQAEVRCGDTP